MYPLTGEFISAEGGATFLGAATRHCFPFRGPTSCGRRSKCLHESHLMQSTLFRISRAMKASVPLEILTVSVS